MGNKAYIAQELEKIKERKKEIDEKIFQLREEQYDLDIRKGDLEGWLLEINEMDGEEPWTW